MTRAFWKLAGVTAIYFVILVLWSVWAISGAAWWQPIFDVRVGGYGLEEARYLQIGLSPEGPAAYRGPFRAADTVFPVLLATSLMLGLWLYHPRRHAVILGLIAVRAAWADLEEKAAEADLLALGRLGFGVVQRCRA